MDHKPLLGLIREKKGIPVNLTARIQRWLLFLSNYQYKLVYRFGNKNANVDALSRLPLPGTNKTKKDRNCFGKNLLQLDNSPVHSKEVEIESRRDNIIARVFESVLTGNWGLCENSEKFKDFVCRKNEFWVKLGCLLWGSRAVIPFELEGEGFKSVA